MAVAFDAVGPSSAGAASNNSNTLSWSHTCTGSDRVLLVEVIVGQLSSGAVTTSVTYNSVAMTSVSKIGSNNNTDGYIELFRLIAPATGANTAVVTASTSVASIIGGSVSFTGADQTTPLGTPATATGASGNATVNVTGTTAGNMVADLACNGSGVTSSNQTQRWLKNDNGNSAAGNGAASTAAAGGSVTMSYTNSNDWWAIVGVEVRAADASPQPQWPSLVSDQGTVANTTAATTSTVTITSPTTVAIGNYLVARVAVDNSGSSGAAPGCTVTDPRSNTWTVLGPALADPGAASAGSTAYLCYARVDTAYQAADALTFNWGGVSTTAKAVVVEEWTDIHRITPVAVSAVTNNSGAAGSTTAVTTGAITPTFAGQCVYTCLSTEGIAGDSITYDSDTTNGTWSTLTRLASANATATSNQCVAGQYKQVTAAGAQTWDATITSRDWAAIAVVFAPPPPPAAPVQSYVSRRRAANW